MSSILMWIGYTCLFILLVFVISKFLLINTPKDNSAKNKISFVLAGKTYELELADTPEKRTIGLMNKSFMPVNEGMLFVFDSSGIYPFWMKDTKIALDMIWVNDSGEIVFIKENAQPCSNIVSAICTSVIPGIKPAKYVIELNGGQSKELGLKIGDKLDLSPIVKK